METKSTLPAALLKAKLRFEKMATVITAWAGSATALCLAMIIVLGWGISGPLFGYSDTWQLAINTGTTIITFLMVFIIQKSQNKDSKAIQLKLDELIAANRYTSNRMVDIEELTEEELEALHKYYRRLSDKAAADEDIHQPHSIDAIKEMRRRRRKDCDKGPGE